MSHQKIQGLSSHLRDYPNGQYKQEVLDLLEKALVQEGEQAMQALNYEHAKVLYSSYMDQFPTGSNVKQVQRLFTKAERAIAKKKRIAARSDVSYVMGSYMTDKSYGIEFGKLKVGNGLSSYFRMSVNKDAFNIAFTADEEIETIAAYPGELVQGFMTANFGLAKKVYYPIWAYGGIGVKMQHYFDKESDSTIKVMNQKTWTVFPELGLKAVLVDKLILNAGVQIQQEDTQFQLGIGIGF